MGYSYPDKPRRGLNAVHRLSLGMRPGNLVEVSPDDQLSHRLWNLAYADSDADPKAKVVQVRLGGVTYYLSYRMPVANSYDADIAADLGGGLGPFWSGRVTIHSQPQPAHSFVHALLVPGASWRVDGTDMRVVAGDATGEYIHVSLVGLCGNGVLDGGEQCDGGACCTAQCTFVSAGTTCRNSMAICDEPYVHGRGGGWIVEGVLVTRS